MIDLYSILMLLLLRFRLISAVCDFGKSGDCIAVSDCTREVLPNSCSQHAAGVECCAPWQWYAVNTAKDGDLLHARHEASFVAFGEQRAYLIGGRGMKPVDEFDARTQQWSTRSTPPVEIHHFQAVVVDDAIHLMCASTGYYPHERALKRTLAYYPHDDEFRFLHDIPMRARGSCGAALFRGKIYMVGGTIGGHVDGWQSWFDSYDPVSGEWLQLTPAPHARDHHQVAIVGHTLCAIGGRQTNARDNRVFEWTVAGVDCYDFDSKLWNTIQYPPLPTPRAGNFVFAWQNRWLVCVGGESAAHVEAHTEVEALDTHTGEWHKWPSLKRGRHGTGVAVVGGDAYVASGCGRRGGSPELATIEMLTLPQ